MDDGIVTTIDYCRSLQIPLARAAEMLGWSRPQLATYVISHGLGWPCPKCGHENGTIVDPRKCPRCELERELARQQKPCAYCKKPMDTGRFRYHEECRRAVRRRAVKRVQKRQDRGLASKVTRQYVKWTPEEDMMLFLPGTIVEIAARLGRTRAACTNRRKILKEAHQ